MQTLDVISVNIWNILIALSNLAILFFLVKKFLYKPVKNMLEKRRGAIDKEYSDAETAKADALRDKEAYAEKLSNARSEADAIISSAVSVAKARENEIVEDARKEAEGILHKAREDAELEMRRAEGAIKDEIVDVSTLLTEKLLEREISVDDHKELIDSFIEKIGDDNE